MRKVCFKLQVYSVLTDPAMLRNGTLYLCNVCVAVRTNPLGAQDGAVVEVLVLVEGVVPVRSVSIAHMIEHHIRHHPHPWWHNAPLACNQVLMHDTHQCVTH